MKQLTLILIAVFTFFSCTKKVEFKIEKQGLDIEIEKFIHEKYSDYSIVFFNRTSNMLSNENNKNLMNLLVDVVLKNEDGYLYKKTLILTFQTVPFQIISSEELVFKHQP